MKVMLDVQLTKELENDDILMYRDGSWINLSKDEYLAVLTNRMNELENDMQTLEVEMGDFKDKVNAKLEQYHNILQVLVKED